MIRNIVKFFAQLSIVIFVCSLFASFSPSLDGRAIVAEKGTFPEGLFAKAVGYLPGDVLSVANISGNSTVEILVIGSLDPSEGVAIMLSPEAAAAAGIAKDSNNIVKITKRTGQDERVFGTAVIANGGETPNTAETVAPPEEENVPEEPEIENDVDADDGFVPAPASSMFEDAYNPAHVPQEKDIPSEAEVAPAKQEEPPVASERFVDETPSPLDKFMENTEEPKEDSEKLRSNADWFEDYEEPQPQPVVEPKKEETPVVENTTPVEEKIPAPKIEPNVSPEKVTDLDDLSEPKNEGPFAPEPIKMSDDEFDILTEPEYEDFDYGNEVFEDEYEEDDEEVAPEKLKSNASWFEDYDEEDEFIDEKPSKLKSNASWFEDSDDEEDEFIEEEPKEKLKSNASWFEDYDEEEFAPNLEADTDNAEEDYDEEAFRPNLPVDTDNADEDYDEESFVPNLKADTEDYDDESFYEDDEESYEPESEEFDEGDEELEDDSEETEEESDELEDEDESEDEEVIEEKSEETTEVVDVPEDDEEDSDEYEAIVLVPVPENPPEYTETETPSEPETPETSNEQETNAPPVEVPEETTPEPPVVEEPKVDALSKYKVGSLSELEKGMYYIQIAVYKDEANIATIIEKYGKNYPITIVPNAAGTAQQVMIGPLNIDEYGTVLKRFKSYGFTDAFVRKIK